MKTQFIPLIVVTLVLATSTALSGCSNNSQPKAEVATAKPVPPSQSVLASLDPRYEATLAEGIDFKKPGYPGFLAEVSSMSVHETCLSWTVKGAGPVAKFRFKQPLPPKFTLEIRANAFGPNLGKAIKVRVGGVKKTFIHKDGNSAGTYRLAFESTNETDTVEIKAPKPTSPAESKINSDARQLGEGLVTQKIRGRSC